MFRATKTFCAFLVWAIQNARPSVPATKQEFEIETEERIVVGGDEMTLSKVQERWMQLEKAGA